MGRRQTPAFILRTVNYGDYHVIAHLLGRDTGRIAAIAHGARSSKKRFSGSLEPLRVVEATVSPPTSGDLYKLEELEVTEDYPGIDERIETITAASYATELTRETWREGVDAGPIFELLRRFYSHLPDCQEPSEILRLVHQFEFQLLQLYGLAPSVAHCSRCEARPETMDKLRLSRRGQGLLCADCRHRRDAVGIITDETLAVLRHLQSPEHPLPDSKLDAAIAQAGRVLDNAIEQLVELPLTSRQMLFDLL